MKNVNSLVREGPWNILLALRNWQANALDDIQAKDTNVSAFGAVIHEKTYVFRPNPDETKTDIEGSFYGIHLIQDSENRDLVYQYEDKVTNDNLITADYTYPIKREQDGEIVLEYYTPTSRPVRFQSALMKAAIKYFRPLIIRKGEYGFEIKLSEILQFFLQSGYTVLNIIDTGCRNVDVDKTKSVSSLALEEKLTKSVEASKKKSTHFNPLLGKKKHKSKRHFTRRYRCT